MYKRHEKLTTHEGMSILTRVNFIYHRLRTQNIYHFVVAPCCETESGDGKINKEENLSSNIVFV